MISLYTRELGKVDVLAKGIKKITSKNSSNLEIMSLVEIDIAKGKEVDHLTKVQPVNFFKEIYTDLDKIFIAGYIIKIAGDNLMTQQPDEKIFNLLLSFLEFLNSTSQINKLKLATGFIFKFWHYLGFGVQEEKYSVWLQGDWSSLNDLKIENEDVLKAYEFARNFSSQQSGKRIGSLGLEQVVDACQ